MPPPRPTRMLVAAWLLSPLAACTGLPGSPSRCDAAIGKPVLVFDLFFGEAIPSRPDLTNAEWRDFLNTVVTPNLPDGYTVVDAKGAWMNPVTHRTTEEPAKLLVVAVPETAEHLAAVNRIRTAYQVRFHQQLVGMTMQAGCASF